MATTTSKNGVQVKITAGRLLAVSTPGEAAVDIVSGAYGLSSTTNRLVNRKKVFGPYSVDTLVLIRSLNGADVVTYNDELMQVQVLAEVDPVSGTPTGKLTTLDGTPFASGPLVVTGGDQVNDVLTAKFLNGSGSVQWFRQNPTTFVTTDIVGETGLTYTRKVADIINGVPQIVSAYASSWQPMALGRPTRAAPPSAPLAVTAVAGNGSVTVGWAAPANTNGAALSTPPYLVTRLPGGQQFPVTGLSFVDTGLDNGTTYTYYVQALNDAGASPVAASQPVTPSDSIPLVPGVPTILAAVGFNNRAEVTIAAPVTGDTPASYEITASTGQKAVVASNGLQFQAMTITGLVNNTAVTFTVKGVIGAAMSAASNVSVACTPVASRSLSVTGNTFGNDTKHPMNNSAVSFVYYMAMATFSTLGAEFENFYSSGGIESDGLGTMTAETKCVYGGGSGTRLTKAGANTVVGTPGATLRTDATPLGFTVPKGAIFMMASKVSTTAEILYQGWFAADGMARGKFGVNLTETIDDPITNFNFLTSSPTAGAGLVAPSLLFSDIDGACVGVMIDSNSMGRGDTGDARHAQGVPGRGLNAAGIPYVHAGISGNTLMGNGGSGWINSSTKRIAKILRSCTHAINEGGINDITISNATAAQVMAARVTINGRLGNMPVANTTLFPLLTANGTYAPVASQVPNATFTPIVVGVNALVRADRTRAFLDLNGYVCAPADETRWGVTAGNAPWTVEGTHALQAGAIAGGAKMAAQISVLVAPESIPA